MAETNENEKENMNANGHKKRSRSGPAGIAVVLDFGSQYTQLIARRAREIGVRSVVLNGSSSGVTEITREVAGSGGSDGGVCLVISGGPNSVHMTGAPRVAEGVLEMCEEKGWSVLGICYGMQLLIDECGGTVEGTGKKEYGRMAIQVAADCTIFKEAEREDGQLVWMSHGDEVVRLPDSFKAVAKSQQGAIVAVECAARKMYGLQYHPEVTHSDRGMETLAHFFLRVAGLDDGWEMSCVLSEEVEKIRGKVGPEDHVICALSGGVDSAVAAAVVHKAIGDRLHCVFVDNGLLRYEEGDRVMKLFEEELHLPVQRVDHSKEMMAKLEGVSDPEKKRKIIGAEFIAVFRRCADEMQKSLGRKPEFLVQGTLYPDVIESCPPPGSDRTHSHTIKSHHNVGGLPAELGFRALIEPLRWLFKDEVRKLGELLNVPKSFLQRHPFPGPGLAVRIIGDVTQHDAIPTLRLVDEIFINKIREYGLYHDIWQAFAVFLPIKSVGVQGDCRTHSFVVALRAITSLDGMTADWYPFSSDFLKDVSTTICNSVPAVNRVVYDISSKPPATIEWE